MREVFRRLGAGYRAPKTWCAGCVHCNPRYLDERGPRWYEVVPPRPLFKEGPVGLRHVLEEGE
jgi:hypothetical protein